MARSPSTRIPGEAPQLAVAEAAAPAEVLAQPESDLPDADSIDPSTLRKAVLTRQGWLCPSPPPDEGPARRQGFAV